MANMFSGLTNQISGMVAQKLGKGGAPGEGEEGAADAAAEAQQVVTDENGEEVVAEGAEGAQGAGGVSGLAQGLMMKAMAAKEGMKEKASNFQAPNLQELGGNLMQNVNNLIPGRREETVPTPPEPNPPSEIGGGELVEAEQEAE